MRINIFFAWYNLWIGTYIDRANRTVYICPLPALVIRATLLSVPMRLKNIAHRWHFVLHRSIAFGKGRYPDAHLGFTIFDYFDVGPLQVRRYVLGEWDKEQLA